LKSLRILIVTHSTLVAELGASQMAINLAEALRALGHDVTLWSPQPLPAQTRWWQTLQRMRAKLDALIESQAPYDVIDCPAALITRRACRSAFVVARSTQPDYLYIMDGLVNQFKVQTPKNLVRLPFTSLYTLFHLYLVAQGWRRAATILCLGSLELQWMRKQFPWWRSKMGLYLNAPSESDQAALVAIHKQRQGFSANRIRFLWIGRWTSHKGTKTLVDFIKAWLSHHPQDRFTIAGCGTDAEKDCPADLMRDGKLSIIPAFARKELYSLLASHDVGLFTSKVEGWGLSLNEMLEAGMAVFATEAGGVLDLRTFIVDGLKPFPPTSQSINTLSRTAPSLSEYYQIFTWERITRDYASSILDNSHSIAKRASCNSEECL
jgi:glycosyltransferase involved in cell wall biosynthesis